jgi:hypothetical protein
VDRAPVALKGPPDEITGDNWWEPRWLFVAPDRTVYVAIGGRNTEQLESSRDGGKTWTADRAEAVKSMAFATSGVFAVGDHAKVHIRKP